MKRPVTILLGITNDIYRLGLESMCKREKLPARILESATPEALQQLTCLHLPDIIIFSAQSPDDDLPLLTVLSAHSPASQFLLLYDRAAQPQILNYLARAGNLLGCLCTESRRTEMLVAMRRILDGGKYYCQITSAYLSSQAALLLSPAVSVPSRSASFTPREQEIIRLLCDEFTAKEIASKLSLSTRTVENRKVRIQEKMHVRNIAGIVAYAFRNRLLAAEDLVVV